MMHTDFTYYIPSHRKVYGARSNDLELVTFLYALYMRYSGHLEKCGRYDGVSIFSDTIRVAIGCNGTGTAYEVFDVDSNGKIVKHHVNLSSQRT